MQAECPAPSDAFDRHWPRLLAIVMAVAFVARLVYLRQVALFPFFDQPVGDSAAHLRRAAEIASGVLLPPRPLYYCSIGYPYFLAAVLSAFHAGIFGVCLTQIAAGVVVVALLARIARDLYGSRAGIVAGALAALYGPSAFLEADVLGVVWGQLALAAGMLACLRWAAAQERAPGTRTMIAWLAGAAFGVAATERPNLLVLAPVIAVWMVARTRGRHALRPVLALSAGVALPIAAVLALNLAGSGQWVPLTTSGGINLSLAYHSGATGTFEEPWERGASHFAARHTEPEEAMIARAAAELGHAVTPQQASEYWGRQAIAFIRTHPAEAAWITFRKAALLLNGAEVPNHLDYEFIRERAPALWLMPVGFGAILPLAVIGIGDAFRRRRGRMGTSFLALVSAGAMASVLPFTVADRYRAPMVPALIVAAGAGAVALLRLGRERDARIARGALPVLAAGLIAALIAAVPLVRPLRGRDHWMFAQAYEARGNLPGAIAAYESAVRAEGDDGELLNNLAMAYRAAGNRDRAVGTLRRAITADPGLAYPRRNLGLLLAARGEADSALAELRAALAIEPDDPEGLGAIGALLAERGDTANAAAAFARARALAPDDRRLLGLIQRYSAAIGDGPAGDPPRR
jgi:tetratricopeptide (TPR) repeat protein